MDELLKSLILGIPNFGIAVMTLWRLLAILEMLVKEQARLMREVVMKEMTAAEEEE